jgi:hypothetical protein
MVEVIGDFIEVEPSALLILMSLKLFPGVLPIAWEQCGATADFLANYFGTFYGAHLGRTREQRDYDVGAMSYILNELVENAVKFNEGGTIHVEVGLVASELVFTVENQLSRGTTAALRRKLSALLEGDPTELFVRRVEEKADNPDDGGSGLGLLTMMSDYQAKLGWKLSPVPGQDDALVLCTRARVETEPAALSPREGESA